MKTLESFIRQYAGSFDTDEPGEGHLERFESRLDIRQRMQRRHDLRLAVLRVAAALAAAVAIGMLLYSESGLWDRMAERYAMSPEGGELAEAEQYYTGQLGLYTERIRSLEFGQGEAEKNRVLEELKEMDQQVILLKRDLRQSPGNEMIVNAIIGFYQTKLDIMHGIVSRMEEQAVLL